jgi:RND family efflux transporter MFP subunit
MDPRKKEKLIKFVQILFVVLLLVDLFSHLKSTHAPAIPPRPVVVEKPKLINIAEYITQTGNTVSYNSVDLVGRIEGFLNDITFVDGTFVQKDTPLFLIEPEPYLEKVKAAEAELAAFQADDLYSKTEYARQKKLYQQNATSQNNVEKWFAKSQESEAQVAKAKADLELAKINYSYTHIKAPFDGRIGRHLVDKGNLVGNNAATKLATIEQLDPIYVYFNLNELDYLKLSKEARQKHYSPDNKSLPVKVALQNSDDFNFEGLMDFANTSLDASTGTMELRALLPNPQKILVPGLFVRARIAISPPTPQLTVPTTAVLYDQIGPYVFVVNAAKQVVLSRVTLGAVEQNRQAILTGIKAQDDVIVDGLQNATPGDVVAPKREILAP